MSSMGFDSNNFDDVDEPVWDLPDVVTPSPIKELTPEQLKIVCDHKRRLKRIEAVKKVLLAVVGAMAIIIAMLR